MGPRIGEILALRWGRINSTAAALRVAQAELGHSHMTTTLEVHMRASASGQRHAVD